MTQTRPRTTRSHCALVLVCCLLPVATAAGPIAHLFRDGIFDMKWGATRNEIQRKFPVGAWAGDIYLAIDPRPVLGIERSVAFLYFRINGSGRLVGVQVPFEVGDALAVAHNAEKAFGPSATGHGEFSFLDSAGDVGITWNSDAGIDVAVLRFTDDVKEAGMKKGTYLFISADGAAANISRGALGFD